MCRIRSADQRLGHLRKHSVCVKHTHCVSASTVADDPELGFIAHIVTVAFEGRARSLPMAPEVRQSILIQDVELSQQVCAGVISRPYVRLCPS